MNQKEFLKQFNFSEEEITQLTKFWKGEEMPEDFDAKKLVDSKKEFNRTSIVNEITPTIQSEYKRQISGELMVGIHAPINGIFEKSGIELVKVDDKIDTKETLKKTIESFSTIKAELAALKAGKGNKDEAVKALSDKLTEAQKSINDLNEVIKTKELEKEEAIKTVKNEYQLKERQGIINKQFLKHAQDEKTYGWAKEIDIDSRVDMVVTEARKRGITFDLGEDGKTVVLKSNIEGEALPKNFDGSGYMETMKDFFVDLGKARPFLLAVRKPKGGGATTIVNTPGGSKEVDLSGLSTLDKHFQKIQNGIN